MDWHLLIDTFPHVAQRIFENLESEALEECYAVCKTWSQFLDRNKFFWASLTRNHPGWDTLITLVKSETVSILGKAFIQLRALSRRWAGFIGNGCFYWNHRLENNTHPIFCAIHQDDVEIFQILMLIWPDFKHMKYHQSENVHSHVNINPFTFASCDGSTEIIKYFLEVIANGFEFPQDETLDSDPKSPLGWASLFGHLEAVKILLANNQGNIYAENDYRNAPLQFTLWAAQNDYVEVAKFLLENMDGDKNPTGRAGTPLHLAAKRGNDEIVRLILDNIDGDKNPTSVGDGAGVTPLYYASKMGHLKVVKTILSYIPEDAYVNHAHRYSGWTPLHAASRKGHFEIVRLLILRMVGFERNPKDNLGTTPLHQFARSCDDPKAMEFMIHHTSDPNPKDKKGWTPLHWAARKGHLGNVKVLMHFIRGDKNPRDNCGVTPLHAAVKSNRLELVKFLLANIEDEKNPKACNGSTPLHAACRFGYFDVAKVLLENIEGDLNCKDGNGDAPLHLAAKHGHGEIINLLFSFITSPKDAKGRTPFDVWKFKKAYQDTCKKENQQ